MNVWSLIVVLAAGTLLMKLVGPLTMSRVRVGARLEAVISLLLPAVLAGLIVAAMVDGAARSLDARAAGVIVAVVALLLRAPLLVVLLLAAAATGLVRAVL